MFRVAFEKEKKKKKVWKLRRLDLQTSMRRKYFFWRKEEVAVQEGAERGGG